MTGPKIKPPPPKRGDRIATCVVTHAVVRLEIYWGSAGLYEELLRWEQENNIRPLDGSSGRLSGNFNLQQDLRPDHADLVVAWLESKGIIHRRP
jgi:hypothetical protein